MMKNKRLLFTSMCASVASIALVAVSATTANNALTLVSATTSKTITLNQSFDSSHKIFNNGATSYTLPAVEGERSEISVSMSSYTTLGFCANDYFLYNAAELEDGYNLVTLTIGLNNITSFSITVGSSEGTDYRGSVKLGSSTISQISSPTTTYSWTKSDSDSNTYTSLVLSLEHDDGTTLDGDYGSEYLFVKSITIGWSC